jgi:hypothetical protein
VRAILEIVPDYRPGDPPPIGYTQWHEWAEVQVAAGLRQDKCCYCGLFKFPQELSGKTHTSTAEVRQRGQPPRRETIVGKVCAECACKSEQSGLASKEQKATRT